MQGSGAGIVLAAIVLTACSGGETSAAAPPSTVASATPTPSSAPAVPEPPPAPPPPPSPAEIAATALEAHDYDAVCSYLAGVGFSADVCGWIAGTARDDDDRSLSTTTFERFLRGQHVHRASGSIVELLSAADNSYEVRVSGRSAILDCVDTEFSTTGRFSMWVQDQPAEEVTMVSGLPSSVQVYREWPLYDGIYELARMRGAGSGAAAHALLEHILESWELEYRWVDPDAPDPGVTAPTADVAMPELRALIPATAIADGYGSTATAVATYLDEHALRYAQLAEFPTTRLAALRDDPEQRGQGWRMSGLVILVHSSEQPPEIIIAQGRSFTCAIVPDAASRHQYDNVTFAGIALQAGQFRDVGGNSHPCVVAVGYLRPRGG